MRKAAETGSGSPDGLDHNYRTLVMQLASLIEQIQIQINLLETAASREDTFGSQRAGSNVVVLDDVTPHSVRASTTLRACRAELGATLRSLMDTAHSTQRARRHAGTTGIISLCLDAGQAILR